MSRYVILIATVFLCAAILCAPLGAASVFFETNLASDIPGLAPNLDPNLKNPWGMSFSATSPFWVSNQGSSNSTLYNGAGVPQALKVATPPSPTGQVFANSAGNFLLPAGSGPAPAPATFIFDTLSGKIAGWNAAQGNPNGVAVTEFSATDGAVFTGLAINPAANVLYASDFNNGRIDVFNSSFLPTTVPGGFVDSTLTAGYFPYNIQAVGGKLYVEYDTKGANGRPSTTPNTGIVDVFDLNGTLLQRLVTNTNLNSPWGITQAPLGFGSFAGDILVGNFGDGTISVYDPVTGASLGKLTDQSGNPIVNGGLWALGVRTAGAFDLDAVYLNAGINGEADGLFAKINIVPEPSTFVMLALAAIPLAWRKVHKSHK